jgi:cobalt/nickel transport protein
VTGPARGRSIVPFVVVGLAIALLIGVVVSNFAASTPDALQRAIIDSACRDVPDKEACLLEQEGKPVLEIAPGALLGYQVTWLSGLVGVLATFAVGAGLVMLLRLAGGPSSGTSGHRVE